MIIHRPGLLTADERERDRIYAKRLKQIERDRAWARGVARDPLAHTAQDVRRARGILEREFDPQPDDTNAPF